MCSLTLVGPLVRVYAGPISLLFFFFKEMAMPHGFVTHFLMSPVEFKKAACA